MTNSRKDLVGIAQLCMTDHEFPSFAGIGGKELQFEGMPYIFWRVLETANLQYTIIDKNSFQNPNYKKSKFPYILLLFL